MLLPCPHCGYPAALILPLQPGEQDDLPPRCPRCDGELPIDASSASGAPASDNTDVEDGAAADGAASPVDDVVHDQSGETSGPDSAKPDGTAPAAIAGAAADTTSRNAKTPRRRGRRGAVPSFVRGSAPAQPRRRAGRWYAASAVLALVLALQLLLAQRDELAASARWRPWVASLCSALACDIPAWREPRAYTVLDRSVQPSRTTAGVLAVEVSFRNDARWPQPWPTLLLTLSDIDGREVGMRAFSPAEYREGSARTDRLAPGETTTARLQVREPAPRIVAFTFDFQ